MDLISFCWQEKTKMITSMHFFKKNEINFCELGKLFLLILLEFVDLVELGGFCGNEENFLLLRN